MYSRTNFFFVIQRAPVFPAPKPLNFVSQATLSQNGGLPSNSAKKIVRRVSYGTSAADIDNSFIDVKTPLKRPMKYHDFGSATPLSNKRMKFMHDNTLSKGASPKTSKSLSSSIPVPNFPTQTPTKPLVTPTRHSLKSFMSPNLKSLSSPKPLPELRSIMPNRHKIFSDSSTQQHDEADLKPLTDLSLPSYPSDDHPIDVDLERGLIVSPDKKTGKGKKFIR